MEILGIVLALFGLVFAFEAPRKAFVRVIELCMRSTLARHGQSRITYRATKQGVATSSVILYLRTSSSSLALDNQIASDQGASLEHFIGDGQWLVEKVKALGIVDIHTLDELVRKNSDHARLLAHSFEQSRAVKQGDGISLVLEIEAMERFGEEWYEKYLSKLSLTSTGRGYAAYLLDFYRTIKQASA